MVDAKLPLEVKVGVRMRSLWADWFGIFLFPCSTTKNDTDKTK